MAMLDYQRGKSMKHIANIEDYTRDIPEAIPTISLF
jgi:hypothetical protein